MLTFITAYLLFWFAVLGYMVRLGSQQRRLRRTLDTLRKQTERTPARQRAA